MDSLFQQPWIKAIWGFIKVHPVLWFSILFIIAFFWFINWLASVLPQIDVLRSKVLLPIAKRYQQKKLVKTAIKSDVRGHVNREIAKMKNYLPDGWAGEMDVDWVETEEPASLLADARIVVRVRPVENQDRNFVNAAYYYLRSSFFPKTQAVVPKPHYEASVLYICRKVAAGRGDSTRTIFEDEILEPAIQKHAKIPNHLDDYAHLDARGFFSGTFLRELHLMATDARFTGARNNMTQETTGLVKHIKDFIAAFDADQLTPAAWYNHGSLSKYAILLVANPVKTKDGINAYINRARSQLQLGARRLYVFGSNSESRFANEVISGIETSIDHVRLVERFETPFDYRGDKYGVGAVFEVS